MQICKVHFAIFTQKYTKSGLNSTHVICFSHFFAIWVDYGYSVAVEGSQNRDEA